MTQHVETSIKDRNYQRKQKWGRALGIFEALAIAFIAVAVLIPMVGCQAETTTSNTLYPAKSAENNQWGYVDAKGNWKIDPQFASATVFDNGQAVVQDGDFRYVFIDENGQQILDQSFHDAKAFSQGMAPVESNYLWGFADADGEWMTVPVYKDVKVFSPQGWAGIYTETDDGQMGWGFLSTHTDLHTIAANPSYEDVGAFNEDFAPVKVDGKWGYITETDSMRIQPAYLDAGNFVDGLAFVQDEESGKYGYIDQRGYYVLDPTYDEAHDFSDGLARVLVDGKWGYIDAEGQMVIEPQFDSACDFQDGVAMVEQDGKFGMIDTAGKVLVKPTFEEAISGAAWMR